MPAFITHPLFAIADFDEVTLILGVLLMAGALASGLVDRSFLSLTAAFVLAGFLLGEGGARACSRSTRAASSCTTWRSSR